MDVYEKVATYLDVDPSTLRAYATEDEIGGHQTGWIVGSIFASEGKLLYAILRIMQPEIVLEAGTFFGCSATHMLAALDANEMGTLHSIDPWEGAGADIPKDRLTRWKFHAVDALDYFKKDARRFKKRPLIVFEDGPHGYEWTRDALQTAKDINPDLIISHDILHHLAGPAVSQAWNEVFGEGNYITVLPEGSDCGFGLWRPS